MGRYEELKKAKSSFEIQTYDGSYDDFAKEYWEKNYTKPEKPKFEEKRAENTVSNSNINIVEQAANEAVNNQMSYEEQKQSLKEQKNGARRERFLAALTYLNDKLSGENTDASERQYEDAKNKYSDIKFDMENAKKSAYTNVSNNDDYAEKSKYQEDINDNDYIYINGDETTRGVIDAQSVISGSKVKNSSLYRQMTPKQISDYNYIYSVYGKKEANDYLDELANGDTGQKAIDSTTQLWTDVADEHPVVAEVVRAGSQVPEGVAGIVGLVANATGSETIANKARAVSAATSAVHDTIIENIGMKTAEKDLVGANLKWNNTNPYQFAYEAADQAVRNVVSSLMLGNGPMGAIQSGPRGKAGQAVVNTFISASAMNDSVNRQLNEGATTKEAYEKGITEGVIEFATEMMGGFFGKETGKAFVDEGLEEVTGNLIEYTWDVIKNGKNGEIAETYNNYLSCGASTSTAVKNTLLDCVSETAYAFLLAGVSAGGMSTVTNTVNRIKENASYRNVGKDIKNSGITQNVIDEGLASDPNSNSYNIAKALQEKLGNLNIDENTQDVAYSMLSNRKLGQLQLANQNTITKEHLVNAISSEKNSDVLIKAMSNISEGKKTSRAQFSAIKNSDNAIAAINSEFGTSFKKNNLKKDILDNISSISSRTVFNYSNRNAPAEEQTRINITDKIKNNQQQTTKNDLSKNNKFNIKYNIDATDNEGNVVDITDIFTENDKLFFTTNDNMKVPADSLNINNTEQKEIIKIARHFPTDAAKSFIAGFEYNSNQNVADYAEGFNDVYVNTISTKNTTKMTGEQAIYKGSKFGLTPEQSFIAYSAAQNSQINATHNSTRVEYERKQKISKQSEHIAKQKKEEKIKIDNALKSNKKGANVIGNPKTSMQKAEIELLDGFARDKGLSVIVVDSLRNAIGQDANAVAYKGKIIVGLDTQNGMLLPYAGHELFHILKQNKSSLATAKELQSFIIDVLKNDASYNYNERFNELQKSYKFDGADAEITDNINEEIAANACFTVLLNEQNFNSLVKQNRTLAQRVKDFFANFVNQIRDRLTSLSSRNAEYRALQNNLTAQAKIVNMMTTALNEYKKNSTVDNDGVQSTGIKFSKEINEYSYNMQTVIADYLDSVDNNIVDFVNDAKKETNKKRLEYMHRDIEFKNIDILTEIGRIVNFDVSDFKTKINGETVRHIEKRHGANGVHDHSMKDANDIARVAFILNNADTVERTINSQGNIVYSEQYRTKDNKPSPVVTISKRINGTYYIAMAVPDSKAKCMHIESLFISNKKESAQEFDDNIPKLTPEASLESDSINSISQSDKNVKYSLKDSDGNELSKQQQDYFKKSKIRDEKGNLLVLYHQTGADFTVFNTDNQKAGKYDSEMPTGIFLKPMRNDIGLSGKKQMKVYVNAANPLVISSRIEAKRYFEHHVANYRKAQNKILEIDKKYQRKYDEADIRDDELYKQLFEDFKQKKISSQEFRDGIENTETKCILNEWTNASDLARLDAKLLLDEYFADSEYDGIIVLNDAGSFGRNVTSYIVFNSNQIKNVDNTNPTDDKDIRFSLRDNININNVSKQTTKLLERLSIDENEYSNKLTQLNEQIKVFNEKAKPFVESKEYAELSERRKQSKNFAERREVFAIYRRWADDSGYSAIEEELEKLDSQKYDLSLEKNREKSSIENLRHEYMMNYVNSFSMEQIEKYISDAKNEFGTTNNFKIAGYITPDGSMLDFGGGSRTTRNVDHREIKSILDLPSFAGFSDGMLAFMNMGNIRIDKYSVDITQEPTEAQYKTIRKLINSDYDNFFVDVSNSRGYNNIWAIRYNEDVNPNLIISDIENYFNRDIVPKEDGRMRFSLRENDTEVKRLLKENAYLQDANELLRQELQLTKGHRLNQKQINSVANKLIEKHGAYSIDKQLLTDRLNGLYNYIANAGRNIDEDYIWNTANDIGKMIAKDSLIRDTSFYDEYKELKKRLRETAITVPKSVRKEVSLYADLNKIKVRSNGDIGVDSFYTELSSDYPGLFDANIANEADQLAKIIEVYESIAPIYIDRISNLGYTMEEYSSIIAAEIFDKYFDINEVHTFADKKQKELDLLKLHYTNAIEDMKKSYNRRYKEREKELYKRIERTKKQGQDRLLKQQAHFNEVSKNAKERKQRTIIKNKIANVKKDLSRRLLNPTETSYVPRPIVQSIANICDLINETQIKDPNNNDRSQNIVRELQKLHYNYEQLKNEADIDYKSEYEQEMGTKISLLTKFLEESIGENNGNIVQISQLSLDNLEDIYRIVRDIKNALVDATKQIGLDEKISNHTRGIKIINQLNDTKGMSKSFIGRYEMETLNPIRAVRKITEYNDDAELFKIVNEINLGQRKADKFISDASKPFERLKKDKNSYKKFSEDLVETNMTDSNGKGIQLTENEIVQLIMTVRRHQGKVHLLNGGFILPERKLYAKGKYKDALSKGTVIRHVNPYAIMDMYENLSDYAKEWYRASQYLFNEQAKNAINEVSILLKHRKIATAENYIPLSVDTDYISKEIEGLKIDSTIEGMGSLKSIVPKSKQPLVIGGLNAVVGKHITDVSKYYGLAIPIRNFNKVYSVQTSSYYDPDMKRASVRTILREKWGSNGLNLMDNLISDMQTSRSSKDSTFVDEGFSKVQSGFVQATLAGNISVTIKQAASYPTALANLSGKSLLTGLPVFAYNSKQLENLFNEIDEYTGLHYKRRLGMSSQEIGDLTKENALMSKLPTLINPMKWIQLMDVKTTAALWVASKNEIENDYPDIKFNSEEYWEKVTSLYEDTIENTQPNYDVLHRPELQKTTNKLTKAIIMFKTQPLQNTGILYDATFELRQKQQEYKQNVSTENKKAFDKAKRKFTKAVTSQFLAAVTFSAMSLVAAMIKHTMYGYRDDNDEVTLSSILAGLGDSMMNLFATLLVPVGGGELYEGIKYIGDKNSNDFVSVPVVTTINDLWDDISDTVGMAKKIIQGDKEPRDMLSPIENLAYSVAGVLGIPAKNLVKYSKGIIANAKDVVNGDIGKFESGVKRKPQQNADRYGKYYTDGDLKKAKEILDEMIENKKAEFIDTGKTDSEVLEEAKKSVRTTFSSCYKKQYKDAFEKKDSVKRSEITRILNSTGLFVYENNKTLSDVISEWEKETQEEQNNKKK